MEEIEKFSNFQEAIKKIRNEKKLHDLKEKYLTIPTNKIGERIKRIGETISDFLKEVKITTKEQKLKKIEETRQKNQRRK